MIKAGNMVSGISGLSSVLNAYNNKKAMKYIANENRKIADMQFDYNKKEIERAFEYNLKAITREYANERAGAINEARQLFSQVNMATGNIANVDDDSYKNDLKDTAKNEVMANMLLMLDNQAGGLYDLTNTKVAQTYNLGLNYENAISNINNQEIAYNNYFNQQMVNGLVDIGTAGFKIFGDFNLGKNTSDETANNDYSFNEYDSNYFSKSVSDFGLKPYNPYESLY